MLWSVACSESAGSNGAASGGSSSGGASSTGSGGVAANTGGNSGGTSSGGQVVATTGGSAPATGGVAASGGAAQGGGKGSAASGDAGGAPLSTSCAAELGATANAEDFSMNSDTGLMDPHVLVMSKGDIIRRIFNYTTSGEADHQHEFVFNDTQLVALLAGEGVVIETEGPPLNAASGHTHTVRVHACLA